MSSPTSEWWARSGADNDPFPPLTKIVVSGLQNAVELNGQNAFVVSHDRTSQRYLVTFGFGELPDKRIKTQNLSPVPSRFSVEQYQMTHNCGILGNEMEKCLHGLPNMPMAKLKDRALKLGVKASTLEQLEPEDLVNVILGKYSAVMSLLEAQVALMNQRNGIDPTAPDVEARVEALEAQAQVGLQSLGLDGTGALSEQAWRNSEWPSQRPYGAANAPAATPDPTSEPGSEGKADRGQPPPKQVPPAGPPASARPAAHMPRN
jgi:hypothetical protein